MKDRSDEHVVIPPVDKTEIFENEGGGVTIKQTCYLGEESVICFGKEHISAIVEALQRIGGGDGSIAS